MMTVHDADLALQPAVAADFEALLALRIRAMQPSLQALGRFDPERARERFSGAFVADCMHHIVCRGGRVGCVSLRRKPQALRIDHLYIDPDAQNQGVGRWALRWAQVQSEQLQLPLELAALQGSGANRFYLRHGFVEIGRSEFDIEYRRLPAA